MTTLTTLREPATRAAPPPAPPAPSRDAEALASVLARIVAPRVLVLGCGRGTNLPLAPLLGRARHVDFVDVDRVALDAARAAVEALGPSHASTAFHPADATGLAGPIRGWHDVAASADDPGRCLDALASALLAAAPRFWVPVSQARYDLVVAPRILTQLHLAGLRASERAFLTRFPAEASRLRASQRWRDAMWTFARTLEEQFVRHLDTLCRPDGMVFLSDTVRFTPLFHSAEGVARGSALLMTRTDRITDYLLPDQERLGEWAWTERHEGDAEGDYGHEYDCQAVAYRPRATAAATGARPGPSGAVRPRRLPLNPYLRWGFASYGVACALLVVLGVARGLSLPMVGLLLPAAPLTVFGMIAVFNRWWGGTRLTYMRIAGLYFSTSALLTWALGFPLLPYLELAIVGTIAFQVVGRFACLAVGCCHGRPWRGGIRYHEGEIGNDFPRHLTGVPLFPLPLVDSLIGLGAAGAGTAVLLAGAPTGAGAATSALLYALGRMYGEEARGDAPRPYWGPLSEAQWTSLSVGVAVLALEALGVLPRMAWHVVPAALLALGGLGFGLRRALGRDLFHVRHIDEIARIVHRWRRGAAPEADATSTVDASGVAPVRTRKGLLLSTTVVSEAGVPARVVTFSTPDAPLGRRAARRMARLLGALLGGVGVRLIEGTGGIFHLAASAAREPGGRHGV